MCLCMYIDIGWSPSLGNFVKVNFDAAVFDTENLLGVGVVIRNSRGDFLAGFAKRAPMLLDFKWQRIMRWAGQLRLL